MWKEETRIIRYPAVPRYEGGRYEVRKDEPVDFSESTILLLSTHPTKARTKIKTNTNCNCICSTGIYSVKSDEN